MIEVVSYGAEETMALAQKVGEVLRGGETLELVSDVGGGKTAFVKGLAVGLGITEVVQSPTFTISRLYKGRDNLELHHFDFYRLAQAGVVGAELNESLAQPTAVVAVEWGEIVDGVLPKTRLTLLIKHIDEQTRRLQFFIPQNYHYILPVIEIFKEQQHLA